MAYYRVSLNMIRNGIPIAPEDRRMAEARRCTKICLARHARSASFMDTDMPDSLVDDDAVRRFLEIEPPLAAVVPEFQAIIDEIEETYVGGLYFAAVSAACVSIERMLNLARIELHPYHSKIKQLWGKGPSNAWDENVDALGSWGYFDATFADELKAICVDVRNRYLHSGAIADMRADALRAVKAAYKLLGIFLGFPQDLFRFTSGIECSNPNDPRFKAFYEKAIVHDAGPEIR